MIFFILFHSFFMTKTFVINKWRINTWNLTFTLHFSNHFLISYTVSTYVRNIIETKNHELGNFLITFFFAKQFKYFFIYVVVQVNTFPTVYNFPLYTFWVQRFGQKTKPVSTYVTLPYIYIYKYHKKYLKFTITLKKE